MQIQRGGRVALQSPQGAFQDFDQEGGRYTRVRPVLWLVGIGRYAFAGGAKS